MTVVMYRSQQQGRRGQRIDTRLTKRQSYSRKRDRDINIMKGKLSSELVFLARDDCHSLSLVVQSKVRLNSR